MIVAYHNHRLIIDTYIYIYFLSSAVVLTLLLITTIAIKSMPDTMLHRLYQSDKRHLQIFTQTRTTHPTGCIQRQNCLIINF